LRDNWQCLIKLTNQPGGFITIHFGHFDIHEHQIDIRIIATGFNGFGTGSDFYNFFRYLF
jgi:hypothetical protein